MTSYLIKKATLITLFLMCLSSSSHAADKAIIVFDASGSMWAQLEGKTKIGIAKETLNKLVDNWDENKELGMIAYGHRKKGDCKDIETLVPVGKVDKSSMRAIVNKINPKGKTPISASLTMAANELKFTEDNATVILISDGKETCKADPCATAAELEKLGVNFTAHVIGFGVDKKTSEQLQCIADNTGGKYFPADNAEQLNDALEKVIEKAKVITIRAINEKDENILHKMVDWKLINQDTEEVISLNGTGAAVYLNLDGDEAKDAQNDNEKITAGKWLISGISGNYTGEASAEIIDDNEDQLIKINMNKQLPKVTINAPDEAIAGTEIEVSWEGPKELDGFINVQLADEKPKYSAAPYIYTQKVTSNNLRMPSVAGNYVLRWYDRSDKQMLTERTISLTAADVSINAPTEATTGTEVEIFWKAPKGLNAFINIQLADEKPNYGATPYIYTEKVSSKYLRMPSLAGDYVLRWYNRNDKKMLAESPISLKKEEISINAPAEATAGTEVEISWKAPKGLNAFINIQLADEKPNYGATPYIYTEKVSSKYLRMPSVAGDYVLRWYNRNDKKMLAEKPITLTAVDILITAPAESEIGTEVEVSWEAPKGLDSFINIQLADEKPSYNAKPYIYTQKVSSKYFRMPSIAGDYVLRWYNRSNDKALAEFPITLTAVDISITAPAEAVAGTEVEVSWEAPKGLDGFINIQLADEKPSYNAKPYIYTQKVSSKNLRLPSVPGDYVLRWYNRSNDKALAEFPITLIAVDITIAAPADAVAGTEVEVSWEATEGLDGFINIQLADEKPSYNAKPYVYTKKKSSALMKMPDAAGDYVLRWYNRGHYQTLGEKKILLSIE